MAQQTFRSAFNGFNREDVVHYIEYLNAQHAAELGRLNSELEFLRTKAAPEAQPGEQANTESNDLIEQQATRIRELFDQCKAHEATIADLTAQLDDARTLADAAISEKMRLNADLDQALQQQISFKSRMEEELEAYRRAERTERMARERAEQMYRQANAVLADATVKVDDAAALIGQMSDKVMGELSALQDAVSGSKQALREASATMYTIRPSTDTD